MEIVPNKNHPAIGYPHDYGNPQVYYGIPPEWPQNMVENDDYAAIWR